MTGESLPPMTLFHKVVLALSFLLMVSLSPLICLGRSAAFIPNTWFNLARPLVWLGVAVLILAALAVRIHLMKEPKHPFSKKSLVFVVFGYTPVDDQFPASGCKDVQHWGREEGKPDAH
ncbi:hypothetical protein [uncultured Stenotrophomonas sp.]|uniref:hypothetical protein n=1 Tax=uncultured Stenotrophomonas sp. TaxID=165438 RepID=UPI0028EC94AE|nr:hypothetical protein [uncultured Stenotrophomonas sp.]